MLMSTASVDSAHQFHALPACVEDLSFDAALETGDFQVEDVRDGVADELTQLLSGAAPEWKEFLEKMDADSSTPYSAAPAGFPQGVFEGGGKMSVWSGGVSQSDIASPVIPLSVQQAQLDSLDSQALICLIADDVDQDQLLLLAASSTDDDAPAAAAAAAAAAAPSLPQV